MSIRTVEQGIQLIQRGSLEEGARLLRIAIKDPQLSRQVQATALIWLAETDPDPQFKLRCYQQALEVDPGNQAASERLSLLLAAQLPQQAPARPPETSAPPAVPAGSGPSWGTASSSPPPPPSLPGMPAAAASSFAPAPPPSLPGMPPSGSGYAPPQRTRLARTPLVVGIVTRSQRMGSAFFVTREGMLATTRTVVSGDEHVDVHLNSKQAIPGRVVRSYPEIDLALVQTETQLAELYPATQAPTVADNAPLVAYLASGEILRSVRRATRHEAAAYWIPTTIQQVMDGGGAPVLDPQTNMIVGMLTRNHSRTTGYCYALHAHEIYRRLDQYQTEILSAQGQGNALTYCPSCGHVSRAAAFGAFYCEYCGTTLPFAVEQPMRRFLPATAALYGEAMSRACRHCGSTIGYYNGVCLRCGAEQDSGPLRQPLLRR